MRIHSRLAVLLVALVLIALPRSSAAQSSLGTSEATAFLGAWTLGLDTPQGSVTMDLTLKDQGGKVAGAISAPPLMPEPLPITDIAKDGSSLILKYTLDVQGQSIPAKVSLQPDGDKWKANFDFADGMFTVDGTAVKK